MLDPVRMEAYGAQAQEFVASIRERRPPSVTGEDGGRRSRLLSRPTRSAKEQRTVILK